MKGNSNKTQQWHRSGRSFIVSIENSTPKNICHQSTGVSSLLRINCVGEEVTLTIKLFKFSLLSLDSNWAHQSVEFLHAALTVIMRH